jgi:hypothetical protein
MALLFRRFAFWGTALIVGIPQCHSRLRRNDGDPDEHGNPGLRLHVPLYDYTETTRVMEHGHEVQQSEKQKKNPTEDYVAETLALHQEAEWASFENKAFGYLGGAGVDSAMASAPSNAATFSKEGSVGSGTPVKRGRPGDASADSEVKKKVRVLDNYELGLAKMQQAGTANLQKVISDIKDATASLKDSKVLDATFDSSDRLRTLLKCRADFMDEWSKAKEIFETHKQSLVGSDKMAPFQKATSVLHADDFQEFLRTLGADGETDADLKEATAQMQEMTKLLARIPESVKSVLTAIAKVAIGIPFRGISPLTYDAVSHPPSLRLRFLVYFFRSEIESS